MAEVAERMNQRSQQEKAELAERERELRQREFDALVTKAGIDDAELARLKVLARLIGDSFCEVLDDLDADDGSSAARRSDASSRGNREPGSEMRRRRLRI